MDDKVFNAMTSFQFFCNNFFKQKNIDKLMPKGILRSDWKVKKDTILSEEIESVSRLLDKEAMQRLQSYAAYENKPEIEKRFTAIVSKAMESYKAKIESYYQY